MPRFAHFDPLSVPAAAPKPDDRFRVIVPCGAKKAATRTTAATLYTGRHFGACLAYARSVLECPSRSIFILSAKYGLVGLHDMLDPYDLTMREPGAVAIRTVISQARERGLDRLPVLILGGKHYVARVTRACPTNVCLTDCLTQRGMGEQMAWMDRNHGRLPDDFRALVDDFSPATMEPQ